MMLSSCQYHNSNGYDSNSLVHFKETPNFSTLDLVVTYSVSARGRGDDGIDSRYEPRHNVNICTR